MPGLPPPLPPAAGRAVARRVLRMRERGFSQGGIHARHASVRPGLRPCLAGRVAVGPCLTARPHARADRRQFRDRALLLGRDRGFQEGGRGADLRPASGRYLRGDAARRRGREHLQCPPGDAADDLGGDGVPQPHRARTRGDQPAVPVRLARGRVPRGGRPGRRAARPAHGRQGFPLPRLHGTRLAPRHHRQHADPLGGRSTRAQDPHAAE